MHNANAASFMPSVSKKNVRVCHTFIAFALPLSFLPYNFLAGTNPLQCQMMATKHSDNMPFVSSEFFNELTRQWREEAEVSAVLLCFISKASTRANHYKTIIYPIVNMRVFRRAP